MRNHDGFGQVHALEQFGESAVEFDDLFIREDTTGVRLRNLPLTWRT